MCGGRSSGSVSPSSRNSRNCTAAPSPPPATATGGQRIHRPSARERGRDRGRGPLASASDRPSREPRCGETARAFSVRPSLTTVTFHCSRKIPRCLLLLIVCVAAAMPAVAATVEYHLTIGEKEVNFTGQPRRAIAVNGSIPAPTLTFHEGDLARIHVTNAMKVPSSIHWHGMLCRTAWMACRSSRFRRSSRARLSTTNSRSGSAGPIGITRTPRCRSRRDFTARCAFCRGAAA